MVVAGTEDWPAVGKDKHSQAGKDRAKVGENERIGARRGKWTEIEADKDMPNCSVAGQKQVVVEADAEMLG